MSSQIPASSSRAAARWAVSSAIRTSVDSGRCRPCGAIDPTGSRTMAPASRAWAASSVVRSSNRIGARSASAQEVALDLAAVAARKHVQELDPAWILVRRELPLDEGLELVRERRAPGGRVARHDERLGLGQAPIVLGADDADLLHGAVLEQAVLD